MDANRGWVNMSFLFDKKALRLKNGGGDGYFIAKVVAALRSHIPNGSCVAHVLLHLSS